ncbi:MAG TPA: NUDIX domain-containing protein [Candidatus Saccharimonadales bacterium]|nr:NUDIX domain-containing protein [Candidatus Saccharimonadales bacterium]
MQKPSVGAGCGVIVWRDGKFLMMRRKGSHGAGTWGIPGGSIDFGESWEQCGKREVLEETGMTIKNVRFVAVANDLFLSEGKHFIAIWLEADWMSGEPEIKEPEKCTALGWHTFKDLPSPLLEPTWQNLRNARPDLFA